MDTHSKHLLVEFRGCDPDKLNDPPLIRQVMHDAAVAAGATVVETVVHAFSPQGVTGVVVVEESHLSIHTWPEASYAAMDFFTCGGCDPQAARDLVRSALGARSVETLEVHRGLHDGSVRSIEARGHELAEGAED